MEAYVGSNLTTRCMALARDYIGSKVHQGKFKPPLCVNSHPVCCNCSGQVHFVVDGAAVFGLSMARHCSVNWITGRRLAGLGDICITLPAIPSCFLHLHLHRGKLYVSSCAHSSTPFSLCSCKVMADIQGGQRKTAALCKVHLVLFRYVLLIFLIVWLTTFWRSVVCRIHF